MKKRIFFGDRSTLFLILAVGIGLGVWSPNAGIHPGVLFLTGIKPLKEHPKAGFSGLGFFT